jgi:hypothetical protein
MTYTPIAKGTQNWDVPLNAALATLDANITSSASGALQATNNLSDLTNAAQARTNLGIATGAAADVSVYNVKDHGAIGNNIADDTSAIQYTLSLASGNGGGIVYFPPGFYKISNVLTTYSKVAMVGSGINSTQIIQSSTANHGITGVDLVNPTIRDMSIIGPASGTNKAGILFTLSGHAATVSVTLSNLLVTNFTSHGISIQNAIVSNLTNVTSQTNTGDGFHFVGQTFPGAAGTSVTFNACYANGNTGTGYYLYNMVYSTLMGCAADSNATAYWFDTCQSVTATGCGAESQVGGAFKISGGFGVGLYNNWIYQNNGIGIYVTSNASSVVLTGNTDNSPAGGATNFIKVDSGCHVTQTMNHNTTANSFASLTTNTLDDTAGGTSIQGYAFFANSIEAANFTPAVWQTYTPVWSTSGTAPAIGNGTITGRYAILGKVIVCHINLIAGSTTTFGTGTQSFTLPFTAANQGASYVGNAHLLDTSRWAGQCIISPNASGTSPFFPTNSTTTTLTGLTNTAPQTLTTACQIRMTLVYERA